MPPKRQNAQLQKARESKAQKKIKNEQDSLIFYLHKNHVILFFYCIFERIERITKLHF